MSSELSLTWDEHPKTLVGVFEKLLETHALVDCTIAAEGQYLKAHKIILSACSPYFELLFRQENEKNPIVILKDVQFQELKAMIDFIYTGEVKVPEERLGNFLDAAESLQIKGLGGGKKMSPQNTGNEIHAQRRKGQMPPQLHERLRPADFGDGIYRDDDSHRNKGNLVNIDESFEEPSCEFYVEAPSSCTDEMSVFLSSPTSLPSSACSEIRNLETKEIVSSVKVPLSPCEVHENPDSVVKSELEPMAEVYIPEMDCYIEPKEEETVEDVELEGTDGETSREHGKNPGEAAALQDEPAACPLQPAHDRTRLYVCRVCGKGFHTSTRLERHARTHTGERPFVCDLCGKSFTQLHVLKEHHYIHSGERPFRCDHCGKTFRQMRVLKEHRHIHTGERPYRCEECDFSTGFSGTLHNHKRKAHGVTPRTYSARKT